jgi:predicted enzyme related to lactoylglutathione lyase
MSRFELATSFPISTDLMERVTGIGGIFLKARDPKSLAAWYRDHLGVPIEGDQTYATFTARTDSDTPEMTVWSAFPEDTTYFASSAAPFMINYRVSDLDAMLAQLRAAGATVEDKVDDYEYGRFGWASDPEGNRFELWEPKGPSV